MRLQQPEVAETNTNATAKPIEFTQTASVKSFQILTNLYSEPIRAIVRELFTNAYDSHVAAGCPEKPFSVHLPTQLEPWFAVTDYGTGMSKETIEQIYTGYFQSTKTNTNDEVGCLGLGAKSPLAYATTFSLTSCYNGIKLVYSVFINDRGVPALQLLSETSTSDTNGVTVQIPVKPEDFDEFNSKTNYVGSWFAVKPTVNLNSIKFDKVEYKLTDVSPGIHIAHFIKESSPGVVVNNNSLFDMYHRMHEFFHQTMRSRSLLYVVMGNVAYPVDLNEIPDRENFLDDPALFQNLVIEASIGSVDFTPSREALQYTTRTVEFIASKLTQFLEHAADYWYDRVVALPTWEEKQCLIMQLRNTHEVFRNPRLCKKHAPFDALSDNLYLNLSQVNVKTVLEKDGHTFCRSKNKIHIAHLTQSLYRVEVDEREYEMLTQAYTRKYITRPNDPFTIAVTLSNNSKVKNPSALTLFKEMFKEISLTQALKLVSGKEFKPKKTRQQITHPVVIYSDGKFTETTISEKELMEYYYSSDVVCKPIKGQESVDQIKECIRVMHIRSPYTLKVSHVVVMLSTASVNKQMTVSSINLVTKNQNLQSLAVEFTSSDVTLLKQLAGMLVLNTKLQQIVSLITDCKIKPSGVNDPDTRKSAIKYLKELNVGNYNCVITVNKLWNELLADYPMLTYARGRVSKDKVSQIAEYIKIVDSK